MAPRPRPPHTPTGYPPETAPDTVSRDSTFYFDQVVFQVGKRLFKVPRRRFEQESENFRDMFALPTSDGNVEGSSDEHPLLLEGIAEEEFRTLLRVMFRPHYGASEEESRPLSLTEWIDVLKLTTMWHYATLRAVAIDSLTPMLQQYEPVQWISLARKYDVREWLLPALHALARRKQPLQLHEVEPLGIATAIKMAEVRESYVSVVSQGRGNARGYGSQQFQQERETANFEYEIRRLFEDELEK
ncbi:hypothetical protein K466DRAFT_546042 [Polyporus arcularius HHB13444]|uniref:BTB domain-containing protein n=1 Tax=Polyporus arcularius HHB13444 TaxID=1314778 RepID=A0A5C3PLF1_9APHY|nr:hypothetical protein K466DRAFT_546042 [Polyporus arcularius HHB13444]